MGINKHAELDAWLAQYAMRYTKVSDFKRLDHRDRFYFDGERVFVKSKVGFSIEVFSPTVQSETAMEVLKACVEETPDKKLEILRAGSEWLIQFKDGGVWETEQDQTLELTICLFAKKLFSK